jgi:hypothetical protein
MPLLIFPSTNPPPSLQYQALTETALMILQHRILDLLAEVAALKSKVPPSDKGSKITDIGTRVAGGGSAAAVDGQGGGVGAPPGGT